MKSFIGYMIAFVVGLILWYTITYYIQRYSPLKKKPQIFWYPLQWIISGGLWAVWIMQDMANIAVVLPRRLALEELIVVISYVFLGLGLLFFLKGDKIQRIVDEKSNVTDIRAATIIDFSYAIILYYLKIVNKVPMSTTWVFIGLLGGRELGLSIALLKQKTRKRRFKKACKLLARDALYATIGLIVSLTLAFSINESMLKSVLAALRNF